uniref:Small-subunit processome Utp12 domain-containing protein n=1 Tax=Trichuris muris TaxID=70415 RepID=A0A5S6QKB2_TRIMR
MSYPEFCGNLAAFIVDNGIHAYDCAERRETFHNVPITNLSAKMLCFAWRPRSVTSKKWRAKVQSDLFAVGCSNGTVLVMSVKRQKLVALMKDNECDSVCSIDWSVNDELFTGSGDGRIFRWNFNNSKKAGQWNGHDSSVGSIRCIPTGSELLSASRSIKLWDLRSGLCLTTFSGHETPVLELRLSPSLSGEGCLEQCLIISAAKNDRYMYAWPFRLGGNVRKPLSTFSTATDTLGFTVAAASNEEKAIYVMVTGQDGRLDIFFLRAVSEQLSSERLCSVQIETNETPVKRLPILAAHMLSSEPAVTLLYGFSARVAIEVLHLKALKDEVVLKRDDPLRSRSIALLEKSISKVKRPIVSKERANFLFSEGASSLRPEKKLKRAVDVAEDSMEARLAELFREAKERKVDDEVRLANHSLAVLLVQGLHSKDREILNAVLRKSDEQVIKQTIRAMPLAQIVPLMEEIRSRLRREKVRHSYYLWLKHLVAAHSNDLTNMPPANEVLHDIFRQVNSRMPLLPKVFHVSERLGFLAKRWSRECPNDLPSSSSHAELNTTGREDYDPDEDEDASELKETLSSESLWTKIHPMPIWEKGRNRSFTTNENRMDLCSVVSGSRTISPNGHAKFGDGSSDQTSSEDDSSS